MQNFTGYEYVMIDIANQYGLDNLLFEERIQWVKDNMANLESLASTANKEPLYVAAVMALRKAQNHEPTGYMIGLDACSSGPQIMGTLIGCMDTCTNTGLIDPNVRANIYTATTKEMNKLLHSSGIQVDVPYKAVKMALMTNFYGSRMKPIELFGEDTEELEAFYDAQYLVAPGAVKVMELLLGAWQPDAYVHTWTLPDGFVARCKVMEAVDVRIEVDELDHATFTHRFYENNPQEKGLSIAANVIHSVDGMVVREINRRCNYDRDALVSAYERIQAALVSRVPTVVNKDKFISMVLVNGCIEDYDYSTLIQLKEVIAESLRHKSFPVVCIHDEFKCSPNNMNHLRKHYIEIFMQLADSNLLEDILQQITNTSIKVHKTYKNLSTYISRSNYALS